MPCALRSSARSASGWRITARARAMLTCWGLCPGGFNSIACANSELVRARGRADQLSACVWVNALAVARLRATLPRRSGSNRWPWPRLPVGERGGAQCLRPHASITRAGPAKARLGLRATERGRLLAHGGLRSPYKPALPANRAMRCPRVWPMPWWWWEQWRRPWRERRCIWRLPTVVTCLGAMRLNAAPQQRERQNQS